MIDCPSCGDSFFPAYRGQEFCSSECRKAGTKKPQKMRGRPAGFEDPQSLCRVTGCTQRGVHQHHVVYRQHVEKRGGDIADQRDALSVCELHHDRHHKAKRRIKLSELRPENIEFARELLGEAGDDYLARYYDTTP